MHNEIKVSFPGGKRVDAEYKGFVIKTDQPIHQGGEGSAPAPFDLFLVSIATCSGIYVLSFCQMRNIPTEELSISMRMERDEARKRIGKFILDIQLPQEFPEKYTNAVIKAVNGCAVKIYMQDSPEFEVVTSKS